ncbi:hypothetical protein EON76_03475 [bacterium]|nr:MAG: hypothetical protein EON76_03475 [bacterium]
MRSYNKFDRQHAVDTFRDGAPTIDDAPTSELEANLRRSGISEINLGMSPTGFQELSDQYAVCIEQHRRWLNFTAGNFDADDVPEDGHVRKNKESNAAKMQTKDPKNLFQFNNDVTDWWLDEGRYVSERGPNEFAEFMENGIQMHYDTIARARDLVIAPLAESYRGMNNLYFKKELGNVTLRVIRYDAYRLYDQDGNLVVEQGAQVAKPHFDRGGMTMQMYSSAAGFWIQPHPVSGRRKPTDPIIKPEFGLGKSQVFPGIAHKVIYGSHDPINPLFHGVDRIFDESLTEMPARTSVIGFIDPTHHDLGITSLDTQPDRVDRENLNI